MFTSENELTVSPLTSAEKSWILRLEKVLRQCPSRLELVTVGDSTLGVVDADGAKRSEMSDGACGRDGIELATISGGPIVHGVSG